MPSAAIACLVLLAAPPPRGTVYVVALGAFPAPLLAEARDAVRAEYGVDVRDLAPVPLPPSAYYPPRRRYRAERLLVFLAKLLPRDAAAGARARILGLTAVDISTTKDPYPDWGLFGLGDIGGPAAVVSSFRLARRADGARVAFRVRSTAVHEVGHTFGLEHCDEPRCVMLDARGSIATTDGGTGHLGPRCRRALSPGPPPSR